MIEYSLGKFQISFDLNNKLAIDIKNLIYLPALKFFNLVWFFKIIFSKGFF